MMTSLHYEASLSDYIITFLTFLDFLENEVYKVPKVINFTKDCKTAERYAKIMHCACCSNAVMVFRNLKRCCTVSSSVQHITWNISWRYWQTDNSEILYIWWYQKNIYLEFHFFSNLAQYASINYLSTFSITWTAIPEIFCDFIHELLLRIAWEIRIWNMWYDSFQKLQINPWSGWTAFTIPRGRLEATSYPGHFWLTSAEGL